ncbi:MAG: redoxin domain-containing protein [Planctomycetota bacterium]|jgi:thiol-disulfide isomerase/thioredoxin|nr:redoxin domain-containing protein [Planctomycetota bacterium]
MIKRHGLILFFTASLLAAGCAGEPEPPPPLRARSGQPQSRPAPGQPPRAQRGSGSPLFSLPAVDGRGITVRGPAALFFFTTWCGYCKQAMPNVNRMADAARRRGWQVYGIDVNESPAQVQGFVQAYRPNFPVLLDQSGQVGSRFGVIGYPTFVVLDAGGRVAYQGHDLPPVGF